MMDVEGRRLWTFSETAEGRRYRYEVRVGERVIGRVASRGDADMICRSRMDALRETSRSAFQARQHRGQIMRMQEDIRLLMSTLRSVSGCLRLLKPRDVTRAREEAARTLRALKSRGYVE